TARARGRAGAVLQEPALRADRRRRGNGRGAERAQEPGRHAHAGLFPATARPSRKRDRAMPAAPRKRRRGRSYDLELRSVSRLVEGQPELDAERFVAVVLDVRLIRGIGESVGLRACLVVAAEAVARADAKK